MIKIIIRSNEPSEFNEKVRTPGNQWLFSHPDKHPREKPIWRDFNGLLAEAFSNRCGYCGIKILHGEVDHYISIDSNRNLSYEWSNYRYAESRVNKWKGNHDNKILDPFEIEDGWIEISLPELKYRVTNNCPAAFRERAEFTINQLKLNTATFTNYLQACLKQYERNGDILFLEEWAPLLAQAIKKLETE